MKFSRKFLNCTRKRQLPSDAQAYRYLKTYGAISNIDKHYGALHTQDFRGNVEDVATYCVEGWEGNLPH